MNLFPCGCWTESSISHTLLTGGFSQLLVTWMGFSTEHFTTWQLQFVCFQSSCLSLNWSSVIYLFAITWKWCHHRSRPLPPSPRAAKRKPTRSHQPQKHEASCYQLSSQTLSQGHSSLCILFLKVKSWKQTQGWQYLVTPRKSNLKLYWPMELKVHELFALEYSTARSSDKPWLFSQVTVLLGYSLFLPSTWDSLRTMPYTL